MKENLIALVWLHAGPGMKLLMANNSNNSKELQINIQQVCIALGEAFVVDVLLCLIFSSILCS